MVFRVRFVFGKKSATDDGNRDPRRNFLPELLSPGFRDTKGLNSFGVGIVGGTRLRDHIHERGVLAPLLAGPKRDGRQNKPAGQGKISEKSANAHSKNPSKDIDESKLDYRCEAPPCKGPQRKVKRKTQQREVTGLQWSERANILTCLSLSKNRAAV